MPFDIPDNDVAANVNQSIWMSTDIDILTVGLNGVGVVSGCEVTAQGSPDMTVAIASGTIRIASGAQVAVTSGNGTIGTADATNPRIDLVSASDSGTKTVTAGTAAANPKAPALPSGHIGLAMVYVPANDTTIGSNQITDKRVVLSLGAPPKAKEAYCSADTAITSANTWTDITGMSLSLEAGTWDVHAYAYGQDANSAGTSVGLAIHNGTTQVSSSGFTKDTGANNRFQLSCGALITLTGTTTVKIQGLSSRASSSTTFHTTEGWSGVGVANTACRIRAIRVQP